MHGDRCIIKVYKFKQNLDETGRKSYTDVGKLRIFLKKDQAADGQAFAALSRRDFKP